MIVHGYKDEDGVFALPSDSPQYEQLTKGAEKIWEHEAETWEDCMTAWHEFNGWEPYVPMEERT